MASDREPVITLEEVVALEVWASPANMRRGLAPELDQIKDLLVKLAADWRRVSGNP